MFDFATFMKAERKKQNLTQEDLEALSELDVKQIQDYESKRNMPTFKNFSKVITALGYYIEVDGIEVTPYTIPDIVRTKRKEQGLRQIDLAYISGTNTTTIRNIETGRNTPYLDTLIRVLQTLGEKIETKEIKE